MTTIVIRNNTHTCCFSLFRVHICCHFKQLVDLMSFLFVVLIAKLKIFHCWLRNQLRCHQQIAKVSEKMWRKENHFDWANSKQKAWQMCGWNKSICFFFVFFANRFEWEIEWMKILWNSVDVVNIPTSATKYNHTQTHTLTLTHTHTNYCKSKRSHLDLLFLNDHSRKLIAIKTIWFLKKTSIRNEHSWLILSGWFSRFCASSCCLSKLEKHFSIATMHSFYTEKNLFYTLNFGVVTWHISDI